MIFNFSRKLRSAINKRDSIIELKRLLQSTIFDYSLFPKGTTGIDFVRSYFIMYDFLEKNSSKILKMKSSFAIDFKRMINLSEKINGWVIPHYEKNPIVETYIFALRKKHFYDDFVFVTRTQMTIILKNIIKDELIRIPISEEYAKYLNLIKKDSKIRFNFQKKSPSIARDPINGELILKHE